jgi:hypothetical protein
VQTMTVYTAHVYRDDVTFDLGRYYIYDIWAVFKP